MLRAWRQAELMFTSPCFFSSFMFLVKDSVCTGGKSPILYHI